jgi:hypothetical protein
MPAAAVTIPGTGEDAGLLPSTREFTRDVEQMRELVKDIRELEEKRLQLGQLLAKWRERIPPRMGWRRLCRHIGVHHNTAARALEAHFQSIGQPNPYRRPEPDPALAHHVVRNGRVDPNIGDAGGTVGGDDDDGTPDAAELESAEDLGDEDDDLGGDDDLDGAGDEEAADGVTGGGPTHNGGPAGGPTPRTHLDPLSVGSGLHDADRKAPRATAEAEGGVMARPGLHAGDGVLTKGRGSQSRGTEGPSAPRQEPAAARRATQLMLAQEYEAARGSIRQAQRLLDDGALSADQARRLAVAIGDILLEGRAA